MCRTGDFNLSYESLTDPRTTRARLNNLKATDPQFYAELTSTQYENVNVPTAEGEDLDEDVQNDPDLDATFEDDSDVPINVVRAVVAHSQPSVPVRFSALGEVAMDVAAESNDLEEESPTGEGALQPEMETSGGVPTAVSDGLGVSGDGKRVRTKSKMYSEDTLRWWRDD